MKNRLKLLPLCLIAASAQIANADEIKWNGYLNVIGGILKDKPVSDMSLPEDKQFPDYNIYEEDFSFDPESSGAIQAVKNLDRKTSVTAQLYAQGSDNFKTELKWLYLTYNPTSHSTFRIGKIGSPVYYFSDFYNVGYAYHWVTPPIEVYTFDTTINGIDYIYRDVVGDIDWTAEVFTGGYNQRLPAINANVKTRNTIATVFTASKGGWLNLRAMYFETMGTFEADALADTGAVVDSALSAAEAQLGYPEGTFSFLHDDVKEQVDLATDLEDFKIKYAEVAFRMEQERWLAMGEWVTIMTDQYVYGDLDAWFVTGGYRIGKAMPHVTFARIKSELHDDAIADAVFAADQSNALADPARYFAAAIDSGIATNFGKTQDSITLGLRYETSLHTAIKFELTRFEEKESYPGETAGIGKNLLFRTAVNAIF